MTIWLRRGLMLLAAIMIASVLPLGAAGAQEEPPTSCARGVLIEGRCLSIDGLAVECLDGECIEFVEEITLVCPEGMSPIGGDECELVTAAEQRSEDCPDGARGEVNDCHIFVAKGPDGCPIGSFEVLSGDCKKPVSNARGAYYCEEPNERLEFLTCRMVAGVVLSDCPAGSVLFDEACWNVGGLTPPASCLGFELANTAVLPSGRCRVPEVPFTGCAATAELRRGIEWLEYDPQSGTTIAEGPQMTGCVEPFDAGLIVASCLFNLERWGGNGGDEIDGVPQCTRFDSPVTATCGAAYSQDDSLGGVCARFAPIDSFDPPACPEGWDQNGTACVEQVEFDAFVCPAGMERRPGTTACNEFRPLRTTWICIGLGLLAPDGCWHYVGPQPDVCNFLGTLEDCYSIQDPIAADCEAASGCIALGDFSIPGDVDCDAELTIIDALLIAQYSALVREAHDSCADRVAATQLFVGDGDVNGDEVVDIIDALLIAQCDAGLPVLEGCG